MQMCSDFGALCSNDVVSKFHKELYEVFIVWYI